MNLLELRTEVRRILAETSPTASYFSDDDINKFINEGIKHMCHEADVYELSIPISVQSGVGSYLLPLNFLKMKTVLNHQSIPLDYIPPIHIGAVYTIPGRPLYYNISQSPISPLSWTPSTPYITFPPSCIITQTYITPTTPNGFLYECVVSGTSGPTQPTWITTVGSRQTDGSVTWACREFLTSLYLLNLHSSPTTAGGGVGTYRAIFSAMDEGLYVNTDSPNFPSDKHHYLVLFACFRCAIKAKDIQLASAFMMEYTKGLGLEMGPSTGEEGE